MIEIRKSKDNQFYFVVKAGNGKVLATSETYTRKRNCIKGAVALVGIAEEHGQEFKDFAAL